MTFSPEALCFGPQMAFVRDTSPFVVACTTRRAGKTVGDRVKLLLAALSQPNVTALYVATTRGVAEELMWRGLKRWNDEYALGGSTNDTKLVLELPNGSRVRCSGAKDKGEADKIRGPERIALAIVDEAQNFRESVIQYLVEEVLEPGMLDVGGKLVLTGTPGALPIGYFHAATQNPEFSQHRWSLRENPHLGVAVEEFLAGIRKRRGITEANLTYRREYLGEWVRDMEALMFHYDAARNACAWQAGPLPGWRYLLVFDIGWKDADAVGVLGWPPHTRQVHLVREKVTPKQGITELGNHLRAEVDLFHPERVIGDLGGLGKKIGGELSNRWNIPVEAAEKARKAEHIELLNDGLRTGLALAPPDSVFAQDCAKMQWDMDAKAKGILRESPEFHSDATDMYLYGYRASMHWLEEAAPAKPETRDEIAAAQEREMFAARLAQVERAQDPDAWWRMEDVT